eukprot:12747954-Ditylum_brightwellii.AAC.1
MIHDELKKDMSIIMQRNSDNDSDVKDERDLEKEEYVKDNLDESLLVKMKGNDDIEVPNWVVGRG